MVAAPPPCIAPVDRGAVPAPVDWRERLTWAGERLRLDVPATIDVGALGKGRLVDPVGEQILEVLRPAVPGAEQAERLRIAVEQAGRGGDGRHSGE